MNPVRRSAVRLAGALLALGSGATIVATPASAGPAPLEVRSVDARGGKVVVDVFAPDARAIRSAKVAIGGKSVTTSVSPLATALPPAVVVVLDNAASQSNGSIQLAKGAVSALLPGSTAVAELGVVTTGGGAKAVTRPTTNAEEVTGAVGAVSPTGGSRLWDAVVEAADLLSGTGETQRNIVIFSGSPDVGGGATYTEAANAARQAGATVHVVALAGSTAPMDLLGDLRDRLGGTLSEGPDTGFSDLAAGISTRIKGQYRLEVASPPEVSGELAALSITAGAATTQVSYRPGVLLTGAEPLAYVAPAAEAGGIFGSGLVKWAMIVLGAAAAAGLVFALAQLALRRNSELDAALRHYDDTYGAAGVGDVDGEALAQSALLKRAVEVTGDLAEKRGVLSHISALLERADLPLRPAEGLFFYIAFSFLSVVVTFFLSGNVFATLIVGILAVVLPSVVLDFLAKRRKKRFVAVLPDMLQLLSGTLRAGYSIAQGFEAVSAEVAEPMGKELRRAVMEARLGRPLEEALEGVAERMDSEDFEWAVMAIRIQREVGGNLAELLMTVADTMTQRERLRRDVAALTAEGKMSAIILGMLPPGLMMAMWVMNPEYIQKLFSGTGLFLLGAALVSMVVGFVWMKKTITIEV